MKTTAISTGLYWSFADNFLQQIVNFIVGIVLARVLLPAEFGVLGIITVFIALSDTIANSGLTEALIHRKDASDNDFCTIFWANVTLSIVIYLILVLFSPLIARFFDEPALTSLLRYGGLCIILSSFSSIQRTILMKNINYKKLAIISLIAVFTSGGVATYMAYQGYGIISLVTRMVVGQLITLILLWTLNSWKPRLQFNTKSFLEMYNYGVNLFLSKLLNTIYNNLYYVVIGKCFSAATLGLYTRADGFKNLASSNITNTIQRVSFSALSSEHNPDRQQRLFEKFSLITFVLTSFLMVILFSSARELILILIGDKWIVSAKYLKVLALSGLFLPLYALNLNYLAVKNKTRLYLKIELYTKLFSIPVIVTGVFYGIIPMLIFVSIVSCLMYVVTAYYLDLLFEVSFKSQLVMLFKVIIICSTSSLINYLADEIFALNLYMSFLVHLAVTMSCFILGLKLLVPASFSEVYNFLNRKLKEKVVES